MMRVMDNVMGISLILLCIMVFVYITATCRFEAESFAGEVFFIRWMKASGYCFYCKIMCPYVFGFRQNGGWESSKNYKRMQQIYVKKDVSKEWKHYQAEKYAWILAGIIALLATGSVFWLFGSSEDVMEEYELQRPEYGDMAKEYSFLAKKEEGGQEEIHLTLDAQMYSEKEVEEIFEECYETLKEKVKGTNSSLQEVRSQLDFSVDLLWEGIEISWYSSDYELITQQGEVLLGNALEGENEVTLYLMMSYEQYSRTFEIPVTIVKYSSDTSTDLQTYLDEVQKENLEESTFTLPGEFAGQKVEYVSAPDYSLVIGLVCLIAAVLFMVLYKQQLNMKEQCEARERQMKADYPEIISKLLVLIRAGMPVRRAWIQITEEYQEQKKNQGKIHFALEEMCLTAREMQNGRSEGTAYLEFGERCEQHLYLKLGSLLEQNLKKGNSGIAVLLESERIQALEERRRQVRSAGELAGTKLMMPMIALFALVLMIIMVPSFMTFGV